jgi:hypothetical protein
VTSGYPPEADERLLSPATERQNRPGGSIADSRFGRSPAQSMPTRLAIGLGTIYCGQDELSMNQFAPTGNSYLERRRKPADRVNKRHEWQLSIGVQQEVLPRSARSPTTGESSAIRRSRWIAGCDLYASTSTDRA